MDYCASKPILHSCTLHIRPKFICLSVSVYKDSAVFTPQEYSTSSVSNLAGVRQAN